MLHWLARNGSYLIFTRLLFKWWVQAAPWDEYMALAEGSCYTDHNKKKLADWNSNSLFCFSNFLQQESMHEHSRQKQVREFFIKLIAKEEKKILFKMVAKLITLRFYTSVTGLFVKKTHTASAESIFNCLKIVFLSFLLTLLIQQLWDLTNPLTFYAMLSQVLGVGDPHRSLPSCDILWF